MVGIVPVRIRCDVHPQAVEANDGEFPEFDHETFWTVRECREAAARREGWHYSRGKDICPECWTNGRREPTT